MKLFGYWRSSATYRVRIALELKAIEYDYEPVNLLKGEQHSPAHLTRNPQGLVPAFETEEGGILTQSTAIIEYLEERYPERPLFPADAEGRAKARSIAAIIACTNSGTTARMISRFRPTCPIIAMTPYERTARQLSMAMVRR